jgi:sugar (pentulose or hexulose) kinase
MKNNMLVIDIGTQSLRASVVTKEGEILAFSQQKYEVPFQSPKDGYAEQDIEYYMDKMCKATNELVAANQDIFSDVEGMVVVSFRDSSVILDKNKKPIRPGILWLDQRVTRDPKQSNLKPSEKLLFKLIGMGDTVKYNSERTVSFWYMKHEPGNWDKMQYYVPFGAYFNYKITGHLSVSSADCIGHYPIDFKNGKWLGSNHPKVNVFKIPMNSLPPLVKVGSVIGLVSEEFSKASGIPAGLPLYASGSDKACETFGNGAIDKTVGSVSLGTACTIDVVDTKYSEPEKFLPSYQAPYAGSYDLEIQIYRGLWMIKWYLDNFGENDKIEARKKGLKPEEFLNQEIAKIGPGSDGLVLQPYWGPGLKRPNAKGSVVGFSGVHTRFHFYRAMYEGIAFGLREGLDEIVRKTHKRPSKLVVSGGGSESEIMLHIIADIFNIPVYKSVNSESSTLGGAMSGFLACGMYKTPEEAVEHMYKEGDLIEPDFNNHAIYEKLYQKVYLKMFPSLKQVYENCKDFFLTNENE